MLEFLTQWFCKTLFAHDITESDEDRLEKALENGKTFIFAHCGRCGRLCQIDQASDDPDAYYIKEAKLEKGGCEV